MTMDTLVPPSRVSSAAFAFFIPAPSCRHRPRQFRTAASAAARAYAHAHTETSRPLTLYDRLELTPDVDLSDIKQAYRQMARKYHPDVCSSEESTRRFIEIQEAYETLSDPRRRAVYDHAVAMGKGPAASGRVSWKASERDSQPLEWRSQWESQLVGLRQRSAMKSQRNDSWSAQVRRQNGL